MVEGINKVFNISNIFNYYDYFFENYDYNKDLFLFGAGGGCRDAINMFAEHNILPIGICDNDCKKWGRNIDGIPIVSPKVLLNRNKEVIVFVSAPNNAEKIIPQLREMMNKNNIYFFQNKTGVKLEEYKNFLKINRKRIIKVYNMLEDHLSKEVLEAMILSRLNCDYLLYEKVYSEDQYFPQNIIDFTENEVLLDVGAYNGDTVKMFIEKTAGIFKKIIAVEPNPDMNGFLKTLADENAKIEVINKGVYREHKKLIFNQCENQSDSSFSYEESEDGIEVDKLDNLIKEDVSLIKMDIEGFELEALQGAEAIIRKYRPKLAICIYHKFHDIVSIPEAIINLEMGYKFYIRHHSWYSGETVLYAI